MFSFFISELAVKLSKKGKHGIPCAIELFLLLFADDLILLSNIHSAIALQNQLNQLKGEADSLFLTVNLDKTDVMGVFYGGGGVWLREKDGSAVLKRSRLQMFTTIWE